MMSMLDSDPRLTRMLTMQRNRTLLRLAHKAAGTKFLPTPNPTAGFVAVDPSQPMSKTNRRDVTLGGYIDGVTAQVMAIKRDLSRHEKYKPFG